MEKFSCYNDPFFGINPFTNPKKTPKSFVSYFKALLKMPLMLLLLVNVGFIRFLVRIKSNNAVRPRVLAANASSFLDVYVLRYLTGIKNFYYVVDGGFVDLTGRFHKNHAEPCVIFPEGCRTNNKAILQFVRDVKVDHICGLKYTGGCVNLYDGYLRSVFEFLASSNSVEVRFEKSSKLKDICSLSGLPQVRWNMNDRNEFVRRYNSR